MRVEFEKGEDLNQMVQDAVNENRDERAAVAALEARQAAEWTREVTIARRAEWRAFVLSPAAQKAGKADMLKINARQKSQGWTMDDLKVAVARHGL